MHGSISDKKLSPGTLPLTLRRHSCTRDKEGKARSAAKDARVEIVSGLVTKSISIRRNGKSFLSTELPPRLCQRRNPSPARPSTLAPIKAQMIGASRAHWLRFRARDSLRRKIGLRRASRGRSALLDVRGYAVSNFLPHQLFTDDPPTHPQIRKGASRHAILIARLPFLSAGLRPAVAGPSAFAQECSSFC
jgi:hypothetical protein